VVESQQFQNPASIERRRSAVRLRPVAPSRGVSRLAPVPSTLSSGRIEGLDLARGLAILGMVLVNFSIDANEQSAAEWLSFAVGAIQGRAAAVFVVIAGAGISLLVRRARLYQRADLLHRGRMTLLRRAGFLLVLGAALLPLWPADILHFYAAYLTVSLLFLNLPSRVLWSSAVAFTMTFVILFFVFDYNAAWNMDAEYVYVWSSTLRRISFDGYYPLFPWMAFILVGMWLGRQDLHDRQELNKLLKLALSIGVATQLFSWYVTAFTAPAPATELDSTIGPLDLLGTSPYPPGPTYIVTSTAFAIAVIVLSLKAAAAFPKNLLVRMLVASGQLALSIYVLHATLGFLLLDSLLRANQDSLAVAVGTALVFCLVAMIFAVVWRRDFERGPLEFVMRRLAAS
jgi:uncharacterized protein